MGASPIGEPMTGLKQILYFGISVVVVKGLGFLLLPVTTRLLDLTEFGELNFLVSVSSVCSLLLCLGLPELLFKQQYNDNRLKLALFRDCLVLSAVVCSLFIVIALIFTHKIIVHLPANVAPLDFQLLCINLSLSALLAIPYTYFRVYNLAKHYCVLAVCHGLLQTVVTISLLLLGKGITGVMFSGMISTLLILLIALFFVIKKLTITYASISWRLNKQHSAFLLAIIVSSLCVYAGNGAENWFIVAHEGEAVLAQYYVAVQFAVMTSFTFEPIRMWWFAKRFDFIKEDKVNYSFSAVRSLNIGLALCAIMLILAPILFNLVLPSAYQTNTWWLPALIIIVAIRHHSDILNIGCFMHKNGLYVTLINACAAVIAMIGLWLLVANEGVNGAILALLIMQLFKAASFFVISQRLEKIQINVKDLIVSWISLACLFCSVVFYPQWFVLHIGILTAFLVFLSLLYKTDIQRVIKAFPTRHVDASIL